MSNSPLVQYTKLSPNYNSPRVYPIKKITIHHVAGVCSVESLGDIFAPVSRYASSNYGIGSDGRIAMYVEERNRSWCSNSPENDHQAITIEVSNSSYGGNWPVSDHVLARLIDLCVDICQRNGIERLNFTGNSNGNLTAHRHFAAVECPGAYLYSKFSFIAEEVNKRLNTFKIGQVIYPIQDIKMKSTAGYANSITWILKEGTKCVVSKYHNANGLYMALKDKDGTFFTSTWTNQFDLFTTTKPIEEEPIEIPEPVTPAEPIEDNPIEEEVDNPIESEKPVKIEIKDIILNFIKRLIDIIFKKEGR